MKEEVADKWREKDKEENTAEWALTPITALSHGGKAGNVASLSTVYSSLVI